MTTNRLTRIDKDQHPEYQQKFKDAVREIFPILCFTPDETEAFLQKYEPQFDGESCVVEDAQGRLTFCHYSIESPESWFIHYIIPSVWADRYTMVREAIQQIKDKFLAENSEHQLRMKIDERVPSHNAYYAALLSELGFELEPRVTMVANQDLVKQLTLPALKSNIQELSYDHTRLQDHIELYFQANSVYFQGFSDEKLAYRQEYYERYISDAWKSDNTIITLTALEHKGKVIGSAFGGLWGNEMSIEEVAILPEFYGQGLGRYLTIRCMQKMKVHFGGTDKHFGLGTSRTYTRALKLYHRLGFKIDKVELYAALTNYQLTKTQSSE